jgi:alpha-D-xyloside xylohydrolase
LSSHSRLHGSSSYRVPWLYSESADTKETAVEVLGFFTRLKCRLMPYLYGAAIDAHRHGLPVMRAMPLMFANDPGCDTLDRQYMLGDNLLVAPVLASDGIVDYYLPAGRWTHFLSGQVIEGGRWLREQHSYLSLPLMVKPNSVIATGSIDNLPDYDYADAVTLQVFELADGSEQIVDIPDGNGELAARFEVRRAGNTVTVRALHGDKTWSVLLRGVQAAATLNGSEAAPEPLGLRIIPGDGVVTVRL